MMRMKWLTGLVVLLVLVVACGGKKPPPPPEPTHVILEIETSDDINPNPAGRAVPVALRIYELKSLSGFNKADFLSLYENEEKVLGGDLVQKQEVMLKPGENKTIHFEASDKTRAVGLFVVFRQYERGRWRATAVIQPNKTSVLPVLISGNSLRVK